MNISTHAATTFGAAPESAKAAPVPAAPAVSAIFRHPGCRRRHAAPRHRAAVAAALLLALAACGEGPKPGAGASAPPPPEVGVITVAPEAAPLLTELPGRVEAVRVAQVRARVTGIVQQRLFREGSEVRAGQLLFRIDPAPYQAAVDSARAVLARAQANAMQAAAQVTRFKPLAEAQAVSQQDYVNAQAAQAQTEADVAAARAALRTAELNLGYASVTAPIAGRIGRALVTEGALVSQAEATQLALIQQIDRVYVNSTQPVAEVARLRRLAGADPGTGADAASVRVLLDDGSELPQRGRLLFSDLSVDPTSAQVTLRAELPNPQGRLLPGMYVRTRLEQGRIEGAVLVPQQAVTRGAQGDTVLVVGADGRPAPRPVKIGGASAARWIVTDGLKPGEQVIVEGFQKMRPGAPVKAVPWAGAAAAQGAPAAAPVASSAAAAASASAASR